MSVDFLVFGSAVVVFLAVILAARRKQAAKQEVLDAEAAVALAEWAVSTLNPKSPNFNQEAYDKYLEDNPKLAAFTRQGRM